MLIDLNSLVGREFYNTEKKICGEIVHTRSPHNPYWLIYNDGTFEILSQLWVKNQIDREVLIEPYGYQTPLWKVLNGESIEDE